MTRADGSSREAISVPARRLPKRPRMKPMRKLDFCRALPLSPAASLDLGEHLPRIFSFRDDAVCGAKCGANLVGRDFVKQGGQIRPNQTSHPRPSNPHSPRHRFPLPMRGFSLYGASFVKGAAVQRMFLSFVSSWRGSLGRLLYYGEPARRP